MKNIISIITKSCVVAIVFALCISQKVGAAPQIMPDGEIFDPDFYYVSYPDVAASIGRNTQKLYQHYLKYGIPEGRVPYDIYRCNTDYQYYANNILPLYGQSLPYTLELSGYMGQPVTLAQAIPTLEYNAAWNGYSTKDFAVYFGVLLYGNSGNIEHIETSRVGPEYTLFGVSCGMRMETAQSILQSKGWGIELKKNHYVYTVYPDWGYGIAVSTDDSGYVDRVEYCTKARWGIR